MTDLGLPTARSGNANSLAISLVVPLAPPKALLNVLLKQPVDRLLLVRRVLQVAVEMVMAKVGALAIKVLVTEILEAAEMEVIAVVAVAM